MGMDVIEDVRGATEPGDSVNMDRGTGASGEMRLTRPQI
jgi:hypothetical protein